MLLPAQTLRRFAPAVGDYYLVLKVRLPLMSYLIPFRTYSQQEISALVYNSDSDGDQAPGLSCCSARSVDYEIERPTLFEGQLALKVGLFEVSVVAEMPPV